MAQLDDCGGLPAGTSLIEVLHHGHPAKGRDKSLGVFFPQVTWHPWVGLSLGASVLYPFSTVPNSGLLSAVRTCPSASLTDRSPAHGGSHHKLPDPKGLGPTLKQTVPPARRLTRWDSSITRQAVTDPQSFRQSDSKVTRRTTCHR